MPRKKRGVREAGRETKGPLGKVLDQSEQVQEKVEDAAVDLASVNSVLKDELSRGAPLSEVVDALAQSLEVEEEVAEAASELMVVNEALAVEIEDRVAIQRELVESQAALTLSRLRERRARRDAMHDELTGLSNAALFKDRVESALAQARRHDWMCAVMFIDLDEFKAINDAHGHDVGDGVLRLVAERLQDFVRDGDTVSRRSGDEFLYLMLEVQDHASARAMAERLIAMLAEPAAIEGLDLRVRASIGLAMFPADGSTSAELLKHADRAMYAVKRAASGGESTREPPSAEP